MVHMSMIYMVLNMVAITLLQAIDRLKGVAQSMIADLAEWEHWLGAVEPQVRGSKLSLYTDKHIVMHEVHVHMHRYKEDGVHVIIEMHRHGSRSACTDAQESLHF